MATLDVNIESGEEGRMLELLVKREKNRGMVDDGCKISVSCIVSKPHSSGFFGNCVFR